MRKVVSAGLAICLAVFVAAGAIAAEQVIRFNNRAEPETVDPGRSTGIPEANVETAVFEGLTRLNANDEPEPGMAERWEISKDGKRYLFHLRQAKWSNGDPVTAHDFEYAWKRVLAPETASEYAYQLWYVKNGQAYNTGKIKDPNQVGVKALDARTLEVTLESPVPYFLSLVSFHTLFPVNRKVVEGNPKWATDPSTYIGNGPFKMVRWAHNSQIEFVKNPNYWDAANVKLDRLIFTLVPEESTELTMYETGQIDMTDGPPPLPEIPRLRAEGKLIIAPYLGSYYYMLNVTKKPLNDVRVRKALALAIDRKAITERVTRGGQLPALAYVPPGLPDAKSGTDFRQVGGTYYEDADVAHARQLLAEAGYKDGKGFPKLTILYNTSEAHKRIAEAIQEMWKKNLGIDVELTNQEWQVYLQSRDEATYQVARAGWIGDYADPMTFLDMWTTGNGNNDTGWGNKRYDALIDQAKNSSDQQVRMRAMHEAESILMAEMPIVPIYFYTNPHLRREYVRDAHKSVLGPISFRRAWVAPH